MLMGWKWNWRSGAPLGEVPSCPATQLGWRFLPWDLAYGSIAWDLPYMIGLGKTTGLLSLGDVPKYVPILKAQVREWVSQLATFDYRRVVI